MDDGTKYPLIFTLNVMEDIQDKYGSLEEWMALIKAKEPSIKALKFGLGSMLNEGLEIENETAEEKREAKSKASRKNYNTIRYNSCCR